MVEFDLLREGVYCYKIKIYIDNEFDLSIYMYSFVLCFIF